MCVMRDFLDELKERPSWKIELYITMGHFFVSWFFMWVFEPATNPIKNVDTFWWFYLVTASTLGYGDVFPVTLGGRIDTIGILVFGAVLLIAFMIQLGSIGFKIVKKIWSGEMGSNFTNHLLLIGERGERTKTITTGLLNDKNMAHHGIVLCFDGTKTERNPIPTIGLNLIHGVKAKNGFDEESWIARACIDKAWRVGIDVKDDNSALTLCLLVKKLNPQAHIVVALQSMDKFASKISELVGEDIECVPDGLSDWFVRALLNKWSTDVLQSLSKPIGQRLHNIHIPDNFGTCMFNVVEDCFEEQGAQILSVSDGKRRGIMQVNPGDDFVVSGGMVISYLHEERLDDVVYWDELVQGDKHVNMEGVE